MADPRDKPLFLARQGYRQRRMIDAARVLPVFGAFLLLVPVLWDPAGSVDPDPAPRLAERGAYVFAVWALLVLGAALLGRRLQDADTSSTIPAGDAAVASGVPAPGLGVTASVGDGHSGGHGDGADQQTEAP